MNKMAIPFIIFENDFYSVSDEAVQVLEKITGPVAVVSIAGMYRSGKSLFLNKCLLNTKTGFPVGSTISACTRGIWMYPLKTEDGKQLIILDAEGAFSLTADNTHDTRVFVLALLLSSYFIYNSCKNIDSVALQNLSLVTNLSRFVKVSNDTCVDSKCIDLAEYMPNLLWILRDFTLQLVDADGRELTPSQYLEKALQKDSGGNDTVKETLCNAFPKRECATLVRPCADETNLQKLDTLSIDEFRPEFVEKITALRKHIYTTAPIKTVGEKKNPVNGSVLVGLAQQYVSSLNSGCLPVIRNTWAMVSEIESLKVVDALVSRAIKVPSDKVSPEQLNAFFAQYICDVQAEFLSHDYCTVENMHTLTQKIERVINDAKQNIYSASVEQCLSQLHALKGNTLVEFRESVTDILTKSAFRNVCDVEEFFLSDGFWETREELRKVKKTLEHDKELARVLEARATEYCATLETSTTEKNILQTQIGHLQKNLQKKTREYEILLLAQEDANEQDIVMSEEVVTCVALSKQLNVDNLQLTHALESMTAELDSVKLQWKQSIMVAETDMQQIRLETEAIFANLKTSHAADVAAAADATQECKKLQETVREMETAHAIRCLDSTAQAAKYRDNVRKTEELKNISIKERIEFQQKVYDFETTAVCAEARIGVLKRKLDVKSTPARKINAELNAELKANLSHLKTQYDWLEKTHKQKLEGKTERIKTLELELLNQQRNNDMVMIRQQLKYESAYIQN
jgi:hypothetical protein